MYRSEASVFSAISRKTIDERDITYKLEFDLDAPSQPSPLEGNTRVVLHV